MHTLHKHETIACVCVQRERERERETETETKTETEAEAEAEAESLGACKLNLLEGLHLRSTEHSLPSMRRTEVSSYKYHSSLYLTTQV